MAGDPVPGAADASELFDVDVQQLARLAALIAVGEARAAQAG
jgi:hypothetical protein